MVRGRTRQLGGVVIQYGIAYPGIVAGGAYLTTGVSGMAFDTLLFAVFALTAFLTAIGAMSGPSTGDPINANSGFAGTSDPGESWGSATIVKLLLFTIGTALILTIYTFWLQGY